TSPTGATASGSSSTSRRSTASSTRRTRSCRRSTRSCGWPPGARAIRLRDFVRAIQITNLNGPDEALELVDVPEPEPSHMMTPGSGVLVDVHSAGVSFPEVLQSRGEYQFKPDLPFVPGSEVGGIRRDTGERVAAFSFLGAFAEVAAAPEYMVFPIPDEWSYAQGAALVLNYHTAYFALKMRGRLEPDETVLVHGAAGGVGTASLQVAKGLGARTIA